MSNNLHLQFKFVDRGGRDVFLMYNAEDNKKMQHPLGELRLPISGDGVQEMKWYSDEELKRRLEAGETVTPEQLELELAEQKLQGMQHD